MSQTHNWVSTKQKVIGYQKCKDKSQILNLNIQKLPYNEKLFI